VRLDSLVVERVLTKPLENLAAVAVAAAVDVAQVRRLLVPDLKGIGTILEKMNYIFVKILCITNSMAA
jgi:hypothetical protein